MPDPRSPSARGRPPAHIDDAVATAVLRLLATSRSVALRMQDIADEVGVHRSTLYRRWPTEQALLDLALERTAAKLAEELDPTSVPLGELLARLVVLLDSPSGRGLVRARIILGTARPRAAPPQGAPRDVQARDAEDRAATLDLLVGAVIHRRFIVGEPCDAAWQDRVLQRLATPPPGGTSSLA